MEYFRKDYVENHSNFWIGASPFGIGTTDNGQVGINK